MCIYGAVCVYVLCGGVGVYVCVWHCVCIYGVWCVFVVGIGFCLFFKEKVWSWIGSEVGRGWRSWEEEKQD